MPSRSSFSFVALVFSSCVVAACGDIDELPPEELDVAPVLVDGWSRFPERSFGVGLKTEIRVFGGFGEHEIRDVRCIDGCSVATAPSVMHPRSPAFLVTPAARIFDVRVEVEGRKGPIVVERRFEARSGDMGVLHSGAGPGVPFLSGMRVAWYIGTSVKNVAWDPDSSTIAVTPPFELVGPPTIGDGPDQDAFIGVVVRAPDDLTAPVQGALVHRNGDATASFPLVAVPRGSIAKLHVAVAVSPLRDAVEDERTIARLASDRLTVSRTRPTRAWVVFETEDGRFGLAGTGECLPGHGATFDFQEWTGAWPFQLGDDDHVLTPDDRPTLDIVGREIGRSELVLAVGDATGSADVSVTEDR